MQSLLTSFDALWQALCNLSLAFLADFTLSDPTAFVRFIAFTHKLHSAFHFDRTTWSQRSHVFRLTGTAGFTQCGHTSVGGILTLLLPMTNNRTRKKRFSQVRTQQLPLSVWSSIANHMNTCRPPQGLIQGVTSHLHPWHINNVYCTLSEYKQPYHKHNKLYYADVPEEIFFCWGILQTYNKKTWR